MYAPGGVCPNSGPERRSGIADTFAFLQLFFLMPTREHITTSLLSNYFFVLVLVL